MSSVWEAGRAWWRHASRRPLTYGLGVCTLGLGVASLAVVAALHRDVFGQRLSFPAADQLVTVGIPLQQDRSRIHIPEEFSSRAFVAMGFYASGEASVAVGGRLGRVPAAMVDAGFFRVLGVTPIRGRTFSESDDQRESLVVVSETLLASVGRAGGGSPERLTIGGRVFSIVGVMPRDFMFPGRTQVWVLPRAAPEIGGTFFLPTAIGRLAPSVSLAAAAKSFGPALRLWEPAGGDIKIEPLQLSAYGEPGRVLPLLLTVVVLALVATCCAVSALWVSVLLRQRTEMEIRVAIGASPWHLYRQLGFQFLLPSVAAVLLGFGVAHAALRMWGLGDGAGTASGPVHDLAFLSAAIGFGTVCLTGLAILLTVRSLVSTAGAGLRVRFKRLRRGYAWLSTGQTVVAFVLLSTVAVFVERVGTVFPIDLGLANEAAKTFRLSFPHQAYGNSEALYQVIRNVEASLQRAPGVATVGTVSALPGDGSPTLLLALRTEGTQAVSAEEVTAMSLAASGGFFKTAGVPIIAGRSFTDAELIGTASVAVLSLETVRRLGIDPQDVIGVRLRLGRPRAREVVRVIGVVGDVRYARTSSAVIYEPIGQQQPLPRQLAVVYEAAMGSIDVRQAQELVQQHDPDMPIFDFMELRDLSLLSRSERAAGWLLICLAITSVLQCFVALYGISTQFLVHGMRDVAIALALGLTPVGAVRLVLATLVRPTLYGVGVGALVTVLGVQLAQRLIPNLPEPGIEQLATTGLFLLLIAFVASAAPARQAATMEISRILRSNVA